MQHALEIKIYSFVHFFLVETASFLPAYPPTHLAPSSSKFPSVHILSSFHSIPLPLFKLHYLSAIPIPIVNLDPPHNAPHTSGVDYLDVME